MGKRPENGMDDRDPRFEELEQAARNPVPFQEGVLFKDVSLDAAESEAEKTSFADLRRRLGLEKSVRPGKGGGQGGTVAWFREKPVRWAPWFGALAAILAIAIFLPLMEDDDKLIDGLSIRGLDPAVGQVRSPGSASLPPGTLASGQAFTLDFHLLSLLG